MTFVLDASAALAFIFPDERDADAIRIATCLRTQRAIVPHIWPWEMQNAVVSVERRGRLSATQATSLLSDIAALSVAIETGGGSHVALARRFALSVYDALYLDLAFSAHASIATRDRRLAAAAELLGISIA